VAYHHWNAPFRERPSSGGARSAPNRNLKLVSDWIVVPAWPAYDPDLAAEEELEIPVQVNGKLRSKILVAVGVTEEDIRRLAQADEKVAEHLNGRQIVKIIVVP
jgi:leucyl-tRNA synthetase